MAKALFHYVGAKNKIIKTILQFVPEHKNYAEVFGGS
jgi:site-specific DNA-adenine methylase